jgi:hypothetical protein
MVGTHAPQEGSVSASLRELERLEQDRLDQEREAQRRRRDAEDEARRRVEQCAAEERLAREEREEEARQARARVEREEAARASAMERAIVERAKAEATAEAAAREREREHRRELERASAAEGREVARLRWAARALAAILAMAVIGGTMGYALVLVPRWQGGVEAAAGAVRAREEALAELAALRTKVAMAEGDAVEARRDLAGAASRAEALETQVSDLKREVERLRRPRGGGRAPSVSPAPDTGFSTHCDPGSRDPLCASIGR